LDSSGYHHYEQRNKAMPNNERKDMNAKVLLLGAVITAFALTSYAQAGGAAQLKPQPAIPTVADNTVTTVAYVEVVAPISPRAAANQTKIVKSTAVDRNPALACAKMMHGSPKNISACVEHANMPGCTTVVISK
jgi:hypothetical protein